MPASVDAVAAAQIAGQAAADKLATDITAIDVSEQLVVVDIFLICTAGNERQVGAIVDAIEEALAKEKIKPLRREGQTEKHWVLLDFGDVVVHVQLAEDRMHYSIERLWKDCPNITLDLT